MMSYVQWMNAKASLNAGIRTIGVFIRTRLRLAGLALSVFLRQTGEDSLLKGGSSRMNKMNTLTEGFSIQNQRVAAIRGPETERL